METNNVIGQTFGHFMLHFRSVEALSGADRNCVRYSALTAAWWLDRSIKSF